MFRFLIFSLLAAVVILSNAAGETSLMRGVLPESLGGPEPVFEETASGPESLPPPMSDTLSASTYDVGAIFAFDPLILGGDTIGGAADPSGVLVEWVSEAAEMISHTVSEGETVSDIAKLYGVTPETILWANNLTPSSTIKPGDVLKFPSLSGVLHSVRSGETLSGIASSYGVSVEKIKAANPGVSAASLKVGDELIIPGGRPPSPRKVASALTSGAAQPAIPGYFIMPTTGLNWGRLHYNNAVDIANACGTPVWAAASGVVIEASSGWNGGYGNLIRISHPNGMQTYYAHLQTLLANVGAPVSQGEQIGTIGNTGRTHGPTGCHLHFEVRGGSNPFARYR
jgi:LysM repeat protein